MVRARRDIAVLGSTNTDMVISGRKIPVPGETVSGGTFLMNPGGKGANQAVAVFCLVCAMSVAGLGDAAFAGESATRWKLPRTSQPQL